MHAEHTTGSTDRTSIEARWAAVGSRESAEARLLRARLGDLVREGERDPEVEHLPSLEPLRVIVDRLRRAGGSGDAGRGVRQLIELLEEDDTLRAGVHRYVARMLRALRVTGALADLGIFPAHGFFNELRDRVAMKVLPSYRPPHDLAEAVSTVFARRDGHWLDEVGDELLARLLRAMMPDDAIASASIELGMLRAIDLLSHRLAAAGEDPVLHRFDPGSIDHESPFLAQADQVLAITASRRRHLAPEPGDAVRGDEAHARVLLTQCRESVLGFRRRAPRTGATVRLGYELARIGDLIDRITLLLASLHDEADAAGTARAELLRTLVRRQGDAERIWPLLSRASHLVAAEVVSQAGRTGDHYITRTPKEYGHMWLAAGGAGAIVAMMAAIKVGLGALHAPPLIEAALFSTNYAIGFIVVQVLGLTIATKQPAMTAAALASAMGPEQRRDTRPLVETIMCLVRSQLAAIGGNCMVALPMALLLGTALAWMLGAPIASPEKAQQMLRDIDPLRSPAVAHAALTGVWLTFSGIVAGYAANSAVARHVPERIMRSEPLRRWLGARGVERLAHWSATSAGAWAGCIALGTLLGTTGTVGQMLGLPIDIRHVSFSSANLGLASATVGLANVPWAASLAGIALVGLANLSVSFGLSLGLALHARGRRLRELPSLARDLARSAVVEMYAWVLPIGRTATPREGSAVATH